jgi:hypothetical protein
MPIDAERIQRHGWRQGSVFTLAASGPIVLAYRDRIAVPAFPIDDNARLLLTSHECDVVHPGPHEPRIEICPAVAVRGRLDGNFTGTRNPRRLHLELEIDGAPQPFELRAPTRFCLPRETLESSMPDPDARIAPRHHNHFCHWLAKRYRRAALPTAFDNRISADTRREIRTILRPLQDSIDSVLIAIDPDDRELDANTPYLVQVVALMEDANFSDPRRRGPVENALQQIQQLIDRSVGIELETCVSESMARMSVDIFRDFAIWDYDELSLEAHAEPPHPI